MNKIIICLMSVTVLTIACQNQRPKEIKTEKEVIVVPSSPAPVKDSAKDVSISVDKNGMKVEAKKVDISVRKD
jgi:hypothetical protein